MGWPLASLVTVPRIVPAVCPNAERVKRKSIDEIIISLFMCSTSKISRIHLRFLCDRCGFAGKAISREAAKDAKRKPKPLEPRTLAHSAAVVWSGFKRSREDEMVDKEAERWRRRRQNLSGHFAAQESGHQRPRADRAEAHAAPRGRGLSFAYRGGRCRCTRSACCKDHHDPRREQRSTAH